MTDFPEDRRNAAAAEFVLTELMKVPAFAALSKEDRGAIGVAAAHISVKFYLDGYNRDPRSESLPCRRWFKGCWLGSGRLRAAGTAQSSIRHGMCSPKVAWPQNVRCGPEELSAFMDVGSQP